MELGGCEKHSPLRSWQSPREGTESFMAMQNSGARSFELLLSAGRCTLGGCDADESNRRAIYKDSLLREPEDGGIFESSGALGESQAGATIDEKDGHPGDLPRPQYQPAAAGTQGVSIPAEGSFDRQTQSGLELRHHVHPTLAGFCVFGGDSGLVLPVCSGMEAFEQLGDGILHRGTRSSFGTRESGYFQHGSGESIHQRGFYESIAGAADPNQHGLTRAGFRQHFQRETLEERQIRGYLS